MSIIPDSVVAKLRSYSKFNNSEDERTVELDQKALADAIKVSMSEAFKNLSDGGAPIVIGRLDVNVVVQLAAGHTGKNLLNSTDHDGIFHSGR